MLGSPIIFNGPFPFRKYEKLIYFLIKITNMVISNQLSKITRYTIYKY